MDRGFTLVEMMMVITISAVLMAMVIFYGRGGEKQIILLTEQAKLVNTILRSKSLAIQTFNQSRRPCGYGVHFIPNGYVLFKDLAEDCSLSDKRYSGPDEDVENIILNNAVKFLLPPLLDILFIPPDPIVILIPSQPEAVLTIATLDEASSLKVKVTEAGQVTFQ